MAVWWGTRVECASSLARLRREGRLEPDEEAEAEATVLDLAARWLELTPGEALRERAIRLLRVHALRAPDALQLAAALGWAEGGAHGRQFVTFDRRLATAAQVEGFAVLR